MMAASAMLLAFRLFHLLARGRRHRSRAGEAVPARLPAHQPVPNTVIATLEKGQRVKVKGTGYGKDFMWHEVALPDGRRGYVFGDGSFHVEK